jgi:hypothetical protein
MPVQSVIFEKRYWTPARAQTWLREHGYKPTFHGKDVDETATQYRFRQAPPQAFSKYRTMRISPSIQLVLGFK